MSNLNKKIKENDTFAVLSNATGFKSNVARIASELSIGTPQELDISILEDFPNHRYTTYDDEKLTSLAESIKQVGLSQPILVWHNTNKNKYIILAGHNRKRACQKIGYAKISAIVKDDISEAEARLLVNTNLDQRGQADMPLYDKCMSIIDIFNDLKTLERENKIKSKSYSALISKDTDNDLALYFGLKKTSIYRLRQLGSSLPKEFFDFYPKCWDLNGGVVIANFECKELNTYLLEYFKDENTKKKKINEKTAKEIKEIYELNGIKEVKSYLQEEKPQKEKVSKPKEEETRLTSEKNSFNNGDESFNNEQFLDNSSPYIIDLSDILEFKQFKKEYKTKEEVVNFVKALLINYSE